MSRVATIAVVVSALSLLTAACGETPGTRALTGGAIGAAVMCALACVLAVAAGAGTCRLVDHSARTMFLREHTGGLPPARLLPSPRHR